MRRRKRTKTIKTIAILTLIIASLTFIKYKRDITEPVDKNDNTAVSVQIKAGSNLGEIAETLEDKGLIKNKLSFEMYTKFNNLETKLPSGRFILTKSLTVPKIIEKMNDPTQREVALTIQEGLRAKDIDEKLTKQGLITKGEFLKALKDFNGWQYYNFIDKNEQQKLKTPLEGYIYPDTYFLDSNDFEPKDLIYLALDNFEKKWNTLDKTNSKLDKYTTEEIVTMASIIENEVFGEQDRKTVAGILWKRLENGWPIGADATLLYITKDRTITSTDLAIDSPYNTRKKQGLPPGPISSPSIEAIKSTLHPTESEYWFYLTTLDTGKVIYSKTNEEHNSNKQKYLY